jgi:hypothetical protein
MLIILALAVVVLLARLVYLVTPHQPRVGVSPNYHRVRAQTQREERKRRYPCRGLGHS